MKSNRLHLKDFYRLHDVDQKMIASNVVKVIVDLIKDGNSVSYSIGMSYKLLTTVSRATIDYIARQSQEIRFFREKQKASRRIAQKKFRDGIKYQ